MWKLRRACSARVRGKNISDRQQCNQFLRSKKVQKQTSAPPSVHCCKSLYPPLSPPPLNVGIRRKLPKTGRWKELIWRGDAVYSCANPGKGCRLEHSSACWPPSLLRRGLTETWSAAAGTVQTCPNKCTSFCCIKAERCPGQRRDRVLFSLSKVDI